MKLAYEKALLDVEGSSKRQNLVNRTTSIDKQHLRQLEKTRKRQSKFIINQLKGDHRINKIRKKSHQDVLSKSSKQFHVFIPPPERNGATPDRLSTEKDEER